MFVWLLLRNRVLTNAVRYERHITVSPYCPQCDDVIETPLHLLRDCPFAVQVWNKVGLGGQDFFQLPLAKWIESNSRKLALVQNGGMPTDILFLSTIWQLWKCRNNMIFRAANLPAPKLCDFISSYALDTYQAMSSNIFVQTKVPIWISWHPPDPPFCKLNTDGSRMQETGGFFGNLYSRNKGISHLVVEMDSLSAVQVIEGSKEQDSLAAVLVEDIPRLRGGFIAFSIQHTLREGNRAADFMAEIGHNLPTGTTVFDLPPPGLITFLEADTLGVAFLRH
ncbi:hypothetical protein SLEP1_g59787 [Rubroshorea leprosula]|uniref:Uncharacterized protein n=1 Tax=Rubroshorea leprosula TaxID=152421 RepID=A0AAV5MXY4_9ROSI|nr:hypothetical protein SLEP1_g59787 [Rubroshorea leprosula]